MRLGTIALLAAATAAPAEDVDALLRTYVKQHSSPADINHCDRRYVAADFWGKGLGNSVNVALNALAFAVASNRTLLISDDARFRAGFWKYLGDVEARWALKSQIRKCGPEVVQDFFPMNRRCLEEKTCGSGIKWMLCDGRALSHSDAHIVHIRSAVTWLAPLLGENSALDPHIRRRLRILFPKGVNTWGKLYATLLDPQPEASPTHPLHSLIREHSTQDFDLGLHVRHRRSQPLDFVDRHAAQCAAKALKGVADPIIFLATDRPSRLRGLFTKIEEALGRRCSFKILNASQLSPDVRVKLHNVARTDERAVKMGRDWGEHAHERWAAAADFLLVSQSRRVVGTLSSSYSELAAAARGASEAWLFDPIHQLKGRRRARYNWPRSDEYLGQVSSCFRSDATWPLPQYVRLRPGHARAWARGNCVL